MGCAASAVTRSPSTKSIDKILKAEKLRRRTEVKMLLLGAGGAGKSTMIKQMKILYCGGFSMTERKKYKLVIRENIRKGLQILVEVTQQNGCLCEELMESVSKLSGNPKALNAGVVKKIWDDSLVHVTWKNRETLRVDIQESLRHFVVSRSKEVFSHDYLPTDEDIIYSQLKTTGIVETSFQACEKSFTFVDVGGQKSERRKWLHSFDGVDAILFVADLDAIFRKRRHDTFKESLELFRSLSGSPILRSVQWVLFLNKEDLFRSKLERHFSAFKRLFPDYKGGRRDVSAALERIKREFKSKFSSQFGRFYVHTTRNTDTMSVKKIFTSLQTTVLLDGLNDFSKLL